MDFSPDERKIYIYYTKIIREFLPLKEKNTCFPEKGRV